jgi:hypothetical protein
LPVAAANLTVDPPKTDRLVESLVVGEACRRGRALLREYEQDARPIGAVAIEPLTPRARVRDNQFAVLTADPVLLASLGGTRVVHELSSLAWASVTE